MLYKFLETCGLSFSTPRVVFQSDNFNIMTYIKGERLTYPEYQRLGDREKERLARDEAEFLRELHAVPTDCLANQFPHSVQNKRQQFENDQRELFPILRDMDLLTNELQRS